MNWILWDLAQLESLEGKPDFKLSQKLQTSFPYFSRVYFHTPKADKNNVPPLNKEQLVLTTKMTVPWVKFVTQLDVWTCMDPQI